MGVDAPCSVQGEASHLTHCLTKPEPYVDLEAVTLLRFHKKKSRNK